MPMNLADKLDTFYFCNYIKNTILYRP